MLKEGMGSSERVCFEKGRTCGMCSVEAKRSGVGWAVEWVTGGAAAGRSIRLVASVLLPMLINFNFHSCAMNTRFYS